MSSKRLRSGRCPGQGEQHRVCRLVVVRARFVWRKLQRLAILLVGVPRPARQRFEIDTTCNSAPTGQSRPQPAPLMPPWSDRKEYGR